MVGATRFLSDIPALKTDKPGRRLTRRVTQLVENAREHRDQTPYLVLSDVWNS